MGRLLNRSPKDRDAVSSARQSDAASDSATDALLLHYLKQVKGKDGALLRHIPFALIGAVLVLVLVPLAVFGMIGVVQVVGRLGDRAFEGMPIADQRSWATPLPFAISVVYLLGIGLITVILKRRSHVPGLRSRGSRRRRGPYLPP